MRSKTAKSVLFGERYETLRSAHQMIWRLAEAKNVATDIGERERGGIRVPQFVRGLQNVASKSKGAFDVAEDE